MNYSAFFFLFFVPFLAVSQNNPFKNVTETQQGYIGIGTTTPDALLTVKGSIHTQEVLIDLEGAVAPDYVFETYYEGFSKLKTDYTFLSLTEIETFIKKNHHLPKVPAAVEMDKNGLSLKEMNLLLLEKIEELTLHTIEQQKQIDALSKRIETLENE